MMRHGIYTQNIQLVHVRNSGYGSFSGPDLQFAFMFLSNNLKSPPMQKIFNYLYRNK